jgi:hypothetical protein
MSEMTPQSGFDVIKVPVSMAYEPDGLALFLTVLFDLASSAT